MTDAPRIITYQKTAKPAGIIEAVATANASTKANSSARANGSTEPKRPYKKLNFQTLGEFWDDFEPISYVVDPFIRSSSLYTITAVTGSGKTGFLTNLYLLNASGDARLIGLDRRFTKGRTAFISLENPDEARMRGMVTASMFNIDYSQAVRENIVVLKDRESPENIVENLREMAERDGPFNLILIDTLAAFFDGDNINDNVQTLQFLRRLRPLTQIPGKPAVVVASHPTKNAVQDNLIPYGGGSILNEVDGNLTLWKDPATGYSKLHWQGKLRGVDFKPAYFRTEISSCAKVKDDQGNLVPMPVFMPVTETDLAERETAALTRETLLLRAMLANPNATQGEWAADIRCSKANVGKLLIKQEKEKLVEKLGLGKWRVTNRGKNALGDA